MVVNVHTLLPEREGIDGPVRHVVGSLEYDILFGRLRPRERLVEDALLMRFPVKRHVIRRALDELERMGFVVRSPNRGAAVRDFTAQDVEEIYELRELLQNRAAERIALPGAPEVISMLSEIQRQHDAAVEAGDLRAVDQVNDVFHKAFFAACGNRQLSDAIAHYAHLSRAMRLFPMADPVALKQLRDEHWAMIRALENGDRETLCRLVRQHIQPSRAAYLKIRQTVEMG